MQLAELDISKSTRISEIKVNKFKSKVNAIGTQTLQAIAIAGPYPQIRMLQALG
jgi:major vault protein